MRSNVGKLRQLLVRAVELRHRAQEKQLGLLARADVADGRRHQDAFGALQRAQHDLHRKLASVLAPPEKLDSRADLLCQSLGCGSGSVCDQPFREAFRDDVRHRLPDQLVAAVSERPLRLSVQKDDLPVVVHHHHRIGSRLQEPSVLRL